MHPIWIFSDPYNNMNYCASIHHFKILFQNTIIKKDYWAPLSYNIVHVKYKFIVLPIVFGFKSSYIGQDYNSIQGAY